MYSRRLKLRNGKALIAYSLGRSNTERIIGKRHYKEPMNARVEESADLSTAKGLILIGSVIILLVALYLLSLFSVKSVMVVVSAAGAMLLGVGLRDHIKLKKQAQ
jgi:hypothetical protein